MVGSIDVASVSVVENWSVVVDDTVEVPMLVDDVDELHSGTLKGQSHQSFLGLKTNPLGQNCWNLWVFSFFSKTKLNLSIIM